MDESRQPGDDRSSDALTGDAAGARADRHPADGGVFDVPAGRDAVIIPMRPTVPVGRAFAFAQAGT